MRWFHRVTAALFLTLGLAMFAPNGASAVGLGKTCGGIAGVPCNGNLWCQHPAGKCRVSDAQGKCVVVPTICNKIYKPVCGCNGKNYGNDCARRAARAQLAHTGKCKS